MLIGHSFGALIAALYAAEFPKHVSALVLEAPADLLVMPSETGGLYAQVEARLVPLQRAEFQGYLKRYLDFGRIFDRSETELAGLHSEFGRYFAAALQANGVAAGSLPLAAPADQVGGFMPQTARSRGRAPLRGVDACRRGRRNHGSMPGTSRRAGARRERRGGRRGGRRP